MIWLQSHITKVSTTPTSPPRENCDQKALHSKTPPATHGAHTRSKWTSKSATRPRLQTPSFPLTLLLPLIKVAQSPTNERKTCRCTKSESRCGVSLSLLCSDVSLSKPQQRRTCSNKNEAAAVEDGESNSALSFEPALAFTFSDRVKQSRLLMPS
ncbi:hypothetical protein ACFX2A_038592 [Malus domestica]